MTMPLLPAYLRYTPSSSWAITAHTRPLVSGGMLVARAQRDSKQVGKPTDRHAMRRVDGTDAGMGEGAADSKAFVAQFIRPGIGIFAAAATIAYLWTFERRSAAVSAAAYDWAAVAGIACSALVVWAYARFSRRLDLNAFYRSICPVVVAAFFMTTLSGVGGSLGAYGFAFLAQNLLNLTLWVFLAETVSISQRRPAEVFAVGKLALEAGLLFGMLVSLWVEFAFGRSLALSASAELLAVLFVVATTMVAMGGGEAPVFTLQRGSCDSEGPARPAAASYAERCAYVTSRCNLTPRESEVLSLLAKGHSLPYIRNALYISKGTVDTHARHIYAKCGVHSREELIELVDDPFTAAFSSCV